MIGVVVGVGVFLMMHIDKRLDEFSVRLSRVEQELTEHKADTMRRFEEIKSETARMFEETRAEYAKRLEEMKLDINRRFEEMKSDTNRRFDGLWCIKMYTSFVHKVEKTTAIEIFGTFSVGQPIAGAN